MSDQRGMTLIELLVAVSLSTIVIFACTTVIVTSMHLTAQVTGRITAAQQGRTGIETLLGQLNSGCLVNSTSPVAAGTGSFVTNASNPAISPAVSSDATHLVFTSGLSDSTNPTPTLHVVQLNSSGALLDYAYAYTGTTANLTTPTAWMFSNTPSQILNLAQNVSAPSSGNMFTYNAYSSTTYSLQNASALAVPLTTTSAPTVAQVNLDFVFAPQGAYQANQTSELQDTATFSLSAQDNSAPNGPCQ